MARLPSGTLGRVNSYRGRCAASASMKSTNRTIATECAGGSSRRWSRRSMRTENSGTWLRYTVTSPSGPDPRGKRLLQWLARRQDERNLKALKDVCEGRQPEAHRGPFPQLRSWQWGLICLGLAALVPMMFLAAPFLWLLTVPMAGVLLLHWGNWVMRVCAVPTSKRASALPCNVAKPLQYRQDSG